MGYRTESWQGMNWCRQTTRLAIYLRDGLACVYCGEGIEDGIQLTLDHIRPASKGGSNKPENLATCCHKCNCSRADRPVAAFAQAVAKYVNHDVKAKDIVAHIKETTQRPLPRKEAREMIARRGSVAKAIKAIK